MLVSYSLNEFNSFVPLRKDVFCAHSLKNRRHLDSQILDFRWSTTKLPWGLVWVKSKAVRSLAMFSYKVKHAALSQSIRTEFFQSTIRTQSCDSECDSTLAGIYKFRHYTNFKCSGRVFFRQKQNNKYGGLNAVFPSLCKIVQMLAKDIFSHCSTPQCSHGSWSVWCPLLHWFNLDCLMSK